MKLTILVDSIDYVTNEIYQHQVHEVLKNEHECQYVSINDIRRCAPTYDNVLIATKFRTTVAYAKEIDRWLDTRKCLIQDYDPWVFFDDTSQHRGGYTTVAETIRCLHSFLIPNKHWCDIVRDSTGKAATPFRLGMKPEYCDATVWESRTREIEFKGSSYPTRITNFERFTRHVPVVWNKEIIKPYSQFLKYLSTVRIWAHDESEPITVNGTMLCRNWLWPKALEVLSRGCFLIRDYQPEAAVYGIDRLPTAFLYQNLEEASDFVDRIVTMNDDERNDRIRETVHWIREQNFYVDFSKHIPEWFK